MAQAHLEQLLKRSGHNRVYVTPKTWSHDVSPDYQIIWISHEREAAVQAALSLPSQFGVVCAKGRYGVRVATSAYPASHKQLRPADPLPPQVAVKLTFRVSSVPPGTRANDMVEWGKQIGWPLRALRSTGPRQWLVGSADPPPPRVHAMNSQPLLITPVAQRQSPAPVLSAGRPSQLAAGSVDAPPVDLLAKSDPWAQYLQRAIPAAAPAPRELPAPTSKKFEEQDARMAEFEKGLSALKAGQATLAASTSKVQEQMAGLGQDVESFKCTFAKQLQDNCASLQAAQQAQQAQMQQGFLELKQLLVSTPARANKRPAVGNMELADES